MRCPVCNVELKLAERQGIEIDYCPQCRGVWLDRGELDKIIERSFSAPTQSQSGGFRESHAHQAPPREYEEHSKHYGPQKRKRKSFLEDIFDFD